jgi:hypothetical protein
MSLITTNLGTVSGQVHLLEDYSDNTPWPASGECLENSITIALSNLTETDLTYENFPVAGGFWAEALDESGPNGTPLPVQVCRNYYSSEPSGWTVDVILYADDVAERYDTSTFTGYRLHAFANVVVQSVYPVA